MRERVVDCDTRAGHAPSVDGRGQRPEYHAAEHERRSDGSVGQIRYAAVRRCEVKGRAGEQQGARQTFSNCTTKAAARDQLSARTR